MPNKISATEGIISLIEASANLAMGRMLPEREEALTTVIENITVDTVKGYDTGIWETGINKGEGWVIVKQYDSKEEATKWHEEWVKAIKEHPNMELPSIDVWEI